MARDRQADAVIVRFPKMDRCSACGGYGILNFGDFFPTCHECGGSGQVEARDERGRFLPWDAIEVEDAQPRS